MDSKEPIAHVAEDGKVHNLYDHLIGTARLAADFAAEFGCGEWGRLAGLWHDLGKFSSEFQRYIRAASGIDAHLETKPGRVDHSTAGALLADERFNTAGRIFAYLVAGHHAGLPDWEGDSTGRAALSQRLKQKELLEAARKSEVPANILEQTFPKERPQPGVDPSLWIRMLFSCLVDADFLDTEAFFEPEKAGLRGTYPTVAELLPMFTAYMQDKQAGASDTVVNRLRSQILARCIEKATSPSGIYTLTVPTGGGKTLSSMAFALHHAAKYGKRRVIYVIPYTSIIEQTADQFRKIFRDAVVEHHSNLDVSDESVENSRTRLASENWDAPIIVTTTVQFFESLFAAKTSRCRKLHNVVNSVVILDETQLLPPEFLNPILFALRELQKSYGVTILLSTATQPAFTPHPAFSFDGLPSAIEIMEDPVALHNQLKRVDVVIPENLNDPTSWDELAGRLKQYPSVLCIVNRRDDARALWELMPKGTFHLSALMCGAHRSERIAEIKKRLKEGLPTSVISTQLVEAGVDVDFPIVYRAIAGLDSIAQAAGRCNREGFLEKGNVIVFPPPSKIPAGYLRQAAEIGRRLLAQGCSDHLSPERFTKFFRELYWLHGDRLDAKDIKRDLDRDGEFRFSFRSAAGKFHLIDEKTSAPVIVSYGEGAELIGLLKAKGPERWLLRKLQRYVVNLPRYLHKKLLEDGAIREIHPGIYVQGHGALYHDDLGFCPDKSIVYQPDELMC